MAFWLQTGQLIVNGGFESDDLTGWTLSGYTNDFFIIRSFVHSGNYAADMGAIGSLGYLSQTVATTAGSNYVVSLWMANRTTLTPNEFSVSWNGTSLYDGVNLGTNGWMNFQFIVSAASSSSVLQIGGRMI